MVKTATAWWRRDEPPSLIVEVASAGVDERSAVIGAVRRLPARRRAVVALRYLEDASVDETARLLGRSTGTVRRLASRGLAQLTLELEGAPVEDRIKGVMFAEADRLTATEVRVDAAITRARRVRTARRMVLGAGIVSGIVAAAVIPAPVVDSGRSAPTATPSVPAVTPSVRL